MLDQPLCYATWRVRPDIVLSGSAFLFVSRVGAIFYAQTHKMVDVTSAYRGPRKQAEAMYKKMLGTEWTVYKNKTALQAIRQAFLDGREAKDDRGQVIARIMAVIEEQVGSGIYISNHLQATALDFSLRGLIAKQIVQLKDACVSAGARVVLHEKQPPHIHVQF